MGNKNIGQNLTLIGVWLPLMADFFAAMGTTVLSVPEGGSDNNGQQQMTDLQSQLKDQQKQQGDQIQKQLAQLKDGLSQLKKNLQVRRLTPVHSF